MDIDVAINTTISVGARLGIAAIVLVAGYILAVAARRLVSRLLSRPAVSRAIGPSVVHLIGSTVFYILLVLTVMVMLVAIGVSATTVGTVTLVVIAILALALQQSLANLAATVSFLLFQPFRRGQIVETLGQVGTVREILMFTTVLQLPDDRLVSLANSRIQESGVVNYSAAGSARASFSLTVAYGQDLARIRATILDLASEDPRILGHPRCEVIVSRLGDLGIQLLVLPSVAPAAYWAVLADLQERIAIRFQQEGVRFAMATQETIIHHATPVSG